MTTTAGRTTTRPTSTSSTGFGLLLLSLAGLLALNTALGPLGVGLIRYDFPDTIDHQLWGLEIVTVLLVVPVLVAAAVLTIRGRPGGPLLAIGPAAYTTYMFVQYVLGPEYDHYSLTVLFHLALVTLSGALALWAWRLSADVAPPAATGRQRRVRGALLLGFAAFVLLRYTGGLVGAWSGSAIGAEFAASRTFFWSIFLLDLGVVVPLTVVAGVGAVAGRPWADRAVLAVLGWYALVPPSVAAMAVVMLVRDDPHASIASVTLLSVASLVFGAVAYRVFRSSVQREE
ncbi:MAG TPA: hypothetical protein VFH10_10855 [Nocardioides sp.]|uniref:hypothetical protein n=1 Tax=Nocardioides sp. TaxID=35761 RepID=UPI002D7E39F6|nr:hypothetical protein [Nocardioides sp.]HET6653129.1 hypothetical protein [Nocardioides sp.]